MKEGVVVVSMGYPDEGQLEKINALSRRVLKREEVYVFSVVLCDNEADRDFERFSTEALEKLSELYIGKTGIYDHSMKAKDQVARVFACTVEKVESRYTSTGEPYCRLKALAYMPRSVKNEDIILEIDSGIKKEVSVGCSVGRRYCSICGADKNSHECRHTVGKYYTVKGKRVLCCTVLDDPLDAYEWSFVAVPAQKEAGVTKSFNPDGASVQEDVIKSLYTSGDTLFTQKQKEGLCALFERLKGYERTAMDCTKQLRDEVLSLAIIAEPELDAGTAEEIVKSLSSEGLARYRQTLTKKLDSIYPPCGQLAVSENKAEKSDGNKQFLI